MTSVAFDTLKFVRTLRDKARMPVEQAEGLADAMAEAIQGDLARKVDVDALRTDTKSGFEAQRAETKSSIEALRAETKSSIEALRAETKSSVEALRAETKSSLDALRTEMRSGFEALRAETKADLRAVELRLEAKIEATKGDVIKWVAGMIGFQTLAVIGAVIALARLIRP